jgi:hypothetical protein
MGFREPWQRGGCLVDRRQRHDVRARPAADYDSLEQRGNPGWGGRTFLRTYLAMEDHSLDASSMRGSGGPLGITVPTGTDDETVRLLLEATKKAGWPYVRTSTPRTPSTSASRRRRSRRASARARPMPSCARSAAARTSPSPRTRPQQPRHHQRLPARDRQRRDHRDRARPTCPDDPRERLAAALIDCECGAARRALRHCELRPRGGRYEAKAARLVGQLNVRPVSPCDLTWGNGERRAEPPPGEDGNPESVRSE